MEYQDYLGHPHLEKMGYLEYFTFCTCIKVDASEEASGPSKLLVYSFYLTDPV